MGSIDPPPLITECPNCHTRFRVGESQLQMAHGRVRCGACLAVFAGVDHLLIDDNTLAPELPDESNMLESVLAELAEEDGEYDSSHSDAASAARAFELDALDARREDTLEIAARQIAELEEDSGRVKDKRAAPESAAANDSAAGRMDVAQSPPQDWTAQSVDTEEFAPRVSAKNTVQEPAKREPRATIAEALDSEEALRWWLEDELPGVTEESLDDDNMLVQLSELDVVREDEELDLSELLGDVEDDNADRLEALFGELPEDEAVTSQAAAAKQSSPPKPAAKPAQRERAAAGKPAEPLVTRAMENGTIAAAAAKLASISRSQAESASVSASVSGATPAVTTAATPEPASVVTTAPEPEPAPEPELEIELELEPVLESEPAAEPAPGMATETLAAVAEVKVAAAVETEAIKQLSPAQQLEASLASPAIVDVEPEPLDWNAEEFPETPEALVSGITAEMAIAGKHREPQEANLLQRVTSFFQRFLGNAIALRVATAVAFVLLAAQVLVWQFDDWAKTDTMRPVYAGLCGVVGCELPVRRSLADLQSRKLAVRSHPEKSDALLVDALIINEANFEQPFPTIEMQFMDLNQQLVDSYRVEPSNYLAGELAGSDALMAIRTPVHIDIEIPDPGARAVNYQLQFR